MKIFKITIFFIFSLLAAYPAAEAADLARELSGRLLLQAESRGEVWYINPADGKKYSLGRPGEALCAMRELGIGITNADLEKITIGLNLLNGEDSDVDGLPDRLESSLGTDKNLPDTDGDGYNDKLELENGYSPLLKNIKLPISENFSARHQGKIFLQVEGRGEAWYVNPADQKRYFLGLPSDAFNIMKNLNLGITNDNLAAITTGYLAGQNSASNSGNGQPNNAAEPPTAPAPIPPVVNNNLGNSASNVISAAAKAIQDGDTFLALSYFTPGARSAVEYTLNFLNANGRQILGGLMSQATLSNSGVNQTVYTITVYLGGYTANHNFYIKKQPDGSWLLANL